MADPSPITREIMMLPLLVVEPIFEPAWREFLLDWEQESELPIYLALADFARHLIAQLENQDTGRFKAVFAVVELWHTEGDHYVREAATVGLLESLQNTNLHSRTQPSDFEPWLEASSKKWWEKLNRFWEKGEIMTDD